VSTLSTWLESQLIRDATQFGPLYHGLSNHLPMAMLAMSDLGASDAQIREFRADYSQKRQRLFRQSSGCQW
jgi:hypothetical protein